jgi:hypothetical protein
MAGLKTRAYTTSTFGKVHRLELPAFSSAPRQCAEVIVPTSAADTTELLLKRTLQGVSLMGQVRNRRGTIFILRLNSGWKCHEILRHIGRHLDRDIRLRVNPLSTAIAERMLKGEHRVPPVTPATPVSVQRRRRRRYVYKP